MIEFIQNNWKDLLEILVSLIIGFLGGITFTNIKSKNYSKIKGDKNIVFQEGSNHNE